MRVRIRVDRSSNLVTKRGSLGLPMSMPDPGGGSEEGSSAFVLFTREGHFGEAFELLGDAGLMTDPGADVH